MKNLRLKAARAGMDLSQQDLADAVGVSRQTISAIEKGVNKPTIETAALISDALGCTVSDLIGQTAPMPNESPDLSHLIMIFDQLDESGKKFLIQQAELILQQSAFRKDRSAPLAI